MLKKVLKKIRNSKARKGFTLIELVIVVAIIGILTLMILPQFNNVTNDAKIKTFDSNCQTLTSAIAMYQAGHDGAMPTADTDLNTYINGTIADMQGKPAGQGNATYVYNAASGILQCDFTDDLGNAHSFTYPN